MLIRKEWTDKKFCYFPEPYTNKNKIEVELDWSNYATKTDLKNLSIPRPEKVEKKEELKTLLILTRLAFLKVIFSEEVGREEGNLTSSFYLKKD